MNEMRNLVQAKKTTVPGQGIIPTDLREKLTLTKRLVRGSLDFVGFGETKSLGFGGL